jgi:nicotinamidase-related amidase
MPVPAPVLVIDLQTAMFQGHPAGVLVHASELAKKVRSILAWARTTGHPVCFVRHDAEEAGDPLVPGEPGWPVWPALGQLHNERTFSKSVGDAFSNPELLRWVNSTDAKEVIVMGAQTDYCIAATVKGALQRGLTVTVVSDAHSTVDSDTQSADEIIADHNRMFEQLGARLVGSGRLASAVHA